MKPLIQEGKVVVFTGAGVSAESGLATFRDAGGLWQQYCPEDLATPEAWARDPGLVLGFYNFRRESAAEAEPNPAHLAIAQLERHFDVVVVTQNVDDLHERAGSSNVIHLHGRLCLARSTVDESLIYDIGNKPIELGDTCELGSQLRPHIVWFGEGIHGYDIAATHIKTAKRVLVVGTSLSVFPAAGLVKNARGRAEKTLVSLDIEKKPFGFDCIRGKASVLVPHIVDRWCNQSANI